MAPPSPRPNWGLKWGASGWGEPLLSPPRPERSAHADHPTGVHDRGRCPLYVRAQLEAAGLTCTQRVLIGPGATAREAGETQLTGRFRRWWHVLGSNQLGLSRWFYRPLPLPTPALCLVPPLRQLIEEYPNSCHWYSSGDPL